MRLVAGLVMWFLSAFFIGCQEHFIQPDYEAPLSPEGLSTATGDGLVEIFWNRNREADLAGYNIYVSYSYRGEYTKIGSSRDAYFLDEGTRNGTTYYYAVTAFDRSGNESELSIDLAYDTPRPEGYNITLRNFRTVPALAGYDFSTNSVGPYNDDYTDVFFEYADGSHYLDVWEDTDVQDMGYTSSLYEIGEAPTNGWSPSKDARLIPGHTYVIWTWDNHYAKLRITGLTASEVRFDWAYQLQEGNTRLKPGTVRGKLVEGSGARSRM